MKTYISILFFVINFFTLNAQTKEYFACKFANTSFEEFVHFIEKETGTKIYYDNAQTENLQVTIDSDSITIIEALNISLKNTELKVSKWQNGYVILNDIVLIKKLPQYTQEENDIELKNESELTETEKRYLSGRKADVLETITVGNKNAQSGGKIKVVCKLTDKETGEPIIGGTIYVEETNTGAATDLNGYLVIVLGQGKYNVRISSLGYEQKKYLLNVYSEGLIKVELESSSFSIQEAVIKGDKQMDIKLKDAGLEKLTVKSIKAIPVMVGERDILKVSEMLPGIVSTGEGSSGLNVRGGSSDQNAFYINKIPIYNTSHLFGFFPAFNSDIIKDFAIYKGHIPAEYGGRLSSVFNITTRQGNRKNFSLHGGVNPISAYATVEGPIVKEKSSVLFSVRSSYSDWILSKISDTTISNSSAKFNDFSLGVNYDFKKTLISAFAYSSNDKFNLSDITNYSYSNKGASLNVHHNFNNFLRMNTSVIGSQYSFSTVDKQEVLTSYKHAYQIGHYELRTDFIQTLNEFNELDFGFSGTLYQIDRGKVSPYGIESLYNEVDLGEEQGLEAAIYISDQYDIAPWLTVNAGFRYSFYTSLGSKDVLTYQEDQPRDLNHIKDTLNFGSNQAIKWYKNPEFRVSLNLRTDPNGTIKLAFNQMSQNLFMLNNTVTVAPNTQWKLADYNIEPSKSKQYSIGVFRSLPNLDLEGSVEVFYKQIDNFTDFKDGAEFLNNPYIETDVLQGEQESYGAEFLLKKASGKLNGWIAYTYSRSFVTVDGENEWDQINGGKSYPSNYDIPHVVNAVLNYDITKRLTVSTAITYQKGKPVTYPVSVYYIDDTPLIDYSERNEYRIPDYFRTDISLTLEGNLKKNKLLHSSYMFSVYNLTGRRNAYSVYFISENGYIRSYKYSVIGTQLVTLTWLIKLGNYASQ